MGYHWKFVNDYEYAEIFNDVFHGALSGINGNTSSEIIDEYLMLFTLRSPTLGIKLFLLNVFRCNPIALAILILNVSKPSAEKESWRQP